MVSPSADGRSRADIAQLLAAQAPSGAILAARSTPHYRLCCVRDASFCAVALGAAGEAAAAWRFHVWMADVVRAQAPRMERAVVAAHRGRRPAPEDHLECRFEADGRPGPPDWATDQLDGPGLWLWALARLVDAGPLDVDVGAAAALTASYLAARWAQPTADAWEEHPDARATSTLGAVVAGLRAAQRMGVLEARDRAALRAASRHLSHLGDDTMGLPKSDHDRGPDASLLWLGPLYGLFEPDDRRWAATLRRLEATLEAPHGGVYRYPSDTFYGGGEWPLLAASLALARLSRGGDDDRAKARQALVWIESQADPSGALPEQVTCHPLQPAAVTMWQRDWGPPARPLAWSHAIVLWLRRTLDGAEPPR